LLYKPPRSIWQYSFFLRSTKEDRALLCIVEKDAHGVAASRPDSAHAKPHIHAVGSAFPLDWVVHGEQDATLLTKRNHFGPRLHAGPLFDETLRARDSATLCRSADRQALRPGRAR
jgi:hypothetical protein